MALVINDRVKETSTTSGTGNFTLAGASTGFVTFNSGIGTSNTTYYTIHEQGTNNFEVGLGTLTGSTTLQRDTVLSNSAGNTSKINFGSSTTKDVFCTMPASKSVYLIVAGDYDAVIGIRICNILTATVEVDVYITNSGNKYIAKGVVIPPNSAIELIQGGAKIVLKNGDTLSAVSNTASSVDIVTSYIDTISS
jgi:hypothetical protein